MPTTVSHADIPARASSAEWVSDSVQSYVCLCRSTAPPKPIINSGLYTSRFRRTVPSKVSMANSPHYSFAYMQGLPTWRFDFRISPNAPLPTSLAIPDHLAGWDALLSVSSPTGFSSDQRAWPNAALLIGNCFSRAASGVGVIRRHLSLPLIRAFGRYRETEYRSPNRSHAEADRATYSNVQKS